MQLIKNKTNPDVYGDALLQIGLADPRVVVLDADLARATQTGPFQKAFPDRYFDVGIAEQNLLSVAAGLALSGKLPFAATFANFITKRACDQINIGCAYTRANVRIVGIEPGLSSGRNGATHQSVDDLAIMRAIPNMTVIDPADATEIDQIVRLSLDWQGPVYIRMQRGDIPLIFDPQTYQAEIGKGVVVAEGKDICFLSTGTMTPTAVKVLELLKAQQLNAGLAHFHTIKPIDIPLIRELARTYSAFITCENHSVMGGFGSAVAEVCAAHHPMPIEFVGIADCFGETGSNAYLNKKFGLDEEAMIKAAYRALARIKGG
jgi:transketolase